LRCLELVPHHSSSIVGWSDVSGIGLGPINTSADALNPMATRDGLDIVSRMPPRLSRAWILGRLSEGDDSRANTAGH
jgi:hypothetical protein